ncbi:MAG: hypothetical protein KH100_09800 [Dysgonomonas mossii]|uniref:hypothetical protein n=1 Tax=Dysgonomonas mossii TaxID=163665 RepID=UPI001DADDA8B|nr:hypothetical protein [Dysgonomonas mossii]MBS5797598.1 hypothetical protein [Dysgonomonas mossii]MBS7111477.1 hypothetical protein [Dysgonomonas mossii]
MEKRKVLSIREVTSTNVTLYDILKNDIQDIATREKEKIEHRRLPLNMDFSEFCDLFILFGSYNFKKQNQQSDFVIDADNEYIIKQLYLYIKNDTSFDGDLNKGIMLQGKYGCGKTAILGTYTLLHNHMILRFGIPIPLFTFIKSVNLQELLMKQSIQSFTYKPLVIDEFGRESKTIQDYGNILRPISELLSVRLDIGAVTHGTTNFTLETLASNDFYGAMIGDRLKMMFNFITLQGDSRRK